MNLAVKVAGLLIITIVPSFADLVQGSVTGTFTGLSGGTGSGTNKWTYDPGAFGLLPSSLTFAGNSFGLASTPLSNIQLGSLTIDNNILTNTNQTRTATLTPTANFTTPPGNNVPISGSIGVDEVYLLVFDQAINLSNFADKSGSFSSGGSTYTVHLDGFYENGGTDESGGPISTLTVLNGLSATAYLHGDITAVPDVTTSAVPEPGSIVLLGTILGLVSFSLRKRNQNPA